MILKNLELKKAKLEAIQRQKAKEKKIHSVLLIQRAWRNYQRRMDQILTRKANEINARRAI